MIIGIYKITSPSGKIYIGQSINTDRRIDEYKKFHNCKKQLKIYRSLVKYGPENHQFEVIEECPIEYLDELETWWKLYYNSVEDGLNCNYFDYSPMRGKTHSNSTKRKMSIISIGKSKGKMNDLHKIRISESNLGKLKHTEESKKVIGLKNSHPKPEGFGENHSKKVKGKISNIDKNIYHFINNITKQEYIGTQYNFYNSFNLSQSHVNAVIRGEQKSHRNWGLIKETII